MIMHILGNFIKTVIAFAVAANIVGADKAGIDDIAVLMDPDVGVVFAAIGDNVYKLKLCVRADLSVRAEGIIGDSAVAFGRGIPERDANAIAMHMTVFDAAFIRAGRGNHAVPTIRIGVDMRGQM